MDNRKVIYLDDAIDAVAEGLKRTFVEYRDVAEKMLNKVPSAQPKKKLTFSERKKIVREYQEWCYFYNVLDCVDAFLAYLVIKGYINE